MRRLLELGLRRVVGGSQESWFTAVLAVYGPRAVRLSIFFPGRRWQRTAIGVLSRTGANVLRGSQMIDTGQVEEGDMIVIEQLPVTHKQQLKDEKVARRAAKKAKRAARKARRAA